MQTDRMSKAVRGSMTRLNKVLGNTSSPRLKKYNKLKETDFAQLTAKFGPDVVASYITNMEREKLQGGGDG
jgi:hypothetical protein